MSRLRAALVAVPALLVLVLAGCGSDDEKAAKDPSPSASPSPTETLPTPTEPSPTATVTGPSGETPEERRDTLGGCPDADRIEEIGGTAVKPVADPGPTALCHYRSPKKAEYQGMSTSALEVSVSEPVALPGGQDLAAYRREVGRSNPSRDASGLGGGAFYSYFEDSPAVCAVWFTARDDKVLTVSAVDLASEVGTAGTTSPACELAHQVAEDFRG